MVYEHLLVALKKENISAKTEELQVCNVLLYNLFVRVNKSRL